MAPPSSLPNVHISTHPCVKAKLSQLRSSTTNARETKALIHEITLMLGTEALASCLTTKETGTVSLAHYPSFPAPDYGTLFFNTLSTILDLSERASDVHLFP